MAKVKPKKRPTDIECKDPHLTKQDHGGSADINYIAQQYMSGALPYPEKAPAVYLDLTSVDVQAARETLAALESTFAELPSDMRDALGNDAANYADWLSSEATRIAQGGMDEAIRELVTGETIPEAESAQTAEEPVPAESQAATESTVNPT